MEDSDIIGLVVIALLLFGMGFGVGMHFKNHLMEKDAIEHGVAHYDPITAKFMWNKQIKEEK
jgi:hypothetical protein